MSKTVEVERVLVMGPVAFECSQEQNARNRTVRVYDLEPAEGVLPVPQSDGALQGTFLTSFYLSTLIAHDKKPESREGGLDLRHKRNISPKSWPELMAWLQVMAR